MRALCGGDGMGRALTAGDVSRGPALVSLRGPFPSLAPQEVPAHPPEVLLLPGARLREILQLQEAPEGAREAAQWSVRGAPPLSPVGLFSTPWGPLISLCGPLPSTEGLSCPPGGRPPPLGVLHLPAWESLAALWAPRRPQSLSRSVTRTLVMQSSCVLST